MAESRWYDDDITDEDRASRVKRLCDDLRQEQEPRRLAYLDSVARYEGRELTDTDATTAGRMTYSADIYNLTRSAIDTVQADVAARQRPKPSFLTSAADWKTRRKAKKLDRFIEAHLFETQGSYEDCWQLMLDVFTDACMGGYGKGFAKVTANDLLKKVIVERVLPYEILVDPEEAKYRDPQNLFHSYTVARDMLKDMYADGGKDSSRTEAIQAAIDSAFRDDRLTVRTQTRVTDMVRVYEAWRLPYGDREGRHTICVANQVLFDEPWTRKRFPFVTIDWSRERIGFWGKGLGDEIAIHHRSVNDAAARLLERIRLCSNRVIQIPTGSGIKKDDLAGNDNDTMVMFDPKTGPAVFTQTAPATPQEFQVLEDSIRRAYDFTGVSQMSASSRKAEGITAAVALREMNDIQTVRFLPKARQYEQAFATLGELMIDAVSELGDITAKWPGKSFLRTIDWSDVKMDQELYTVRVVSGSQLSRDIGSRFQMSQELLDAGIITPEDFKLLLGMPDLDAVLDRETADRDYLEMILDRYLDSEDGDELAELGGYESPDPNLPNKQAALMLTVHTYFEARTNMAPEYPLALIRRYMRELIAAINEANQPPAAPPLAAGNPAMPPVGPGAPLAPGSGPGGGAPLPPQGPPAGMPIQ